MRRLAKRLPPSLREPLRRLYRLERRTASRLGSKIQDLIVTSRRWWRRALHPDKYRHTFLYDDDFFKKFDPHMTKDFAVLDYVLARWSIQSAIDFGCGSGYYVAYLAGHGIETIGIEGMPDALRHVVCRTEQVVIHDLTQPYKPPHTYDLAICIEVAEHLPEAAAEAIVDSICRCQSKVIVWSAAVSGQGGLGHINEQPHEYWYERFAQHGWNVDTAHTAQVRALSTQPWLQNNLTILLRGPI
jgi:SAM-dependent methyltransferase